MNKLYHMAKKISSSSLNLKNYNAMLAKHLHLPTNQLEQDHNGTRITTVHKLFRSVLRFKRGVTECCRQINVDPFLS